MRIPKLHREEREFFLYIAPWAIGFICFYLGPIVISFFVSFTDWPLLASPRWIGLDNYIRLRWDPLFVVTIKNTVYYSVGVVVLGTVGAFVAAVLLNQRVRGLAFFRTAFYVPSVTSGIALAVLALWAYNPQYGIVNYVLSLVGIRGPEWLYSPEWAMPAIILLSLLRIGPNMIIFLASLQGVPEQLYEAVRLDGGSWWHELRHVTLPMISSVTLLVMVISIIESFQVFVETYVMTSGGPANATLTYVLYLYRNAFVFLRMGYASALAWILFIILISLTLIQFKLAKRWVYYEGEI